MNVFKKGLLFVGAFLGCINESKLFNLFYRYGSYHSPSAKKILSIYFKYHRDLSDDLMVDMDKYCHRLWRLYFKSVLPRELPRNVCKHVVHEIEMEAFKTIDMSLDVDAELELFHSDSFDKMLWYVKHFEPSEEAQRYLYDIIGTMDTYRDMQYERVFMEMISKDM